MLTKLRVGLKCQKCHGSHSGIGGPHLLRVDEEIYKGTTSSQPPQVRMAMPFLGMLHSLCDNKWRCTAEFLGSAFTALTLHLSF